MSYKTFVAVIFAALLATLCVAQGPTEADVNTEPLIFVSKTTSNDDIVLGFPMEVIVTVSNFGQSPAYDILITDLLEDGTEKSKKVDALAFGESESLRYSVVPKVLGNYPVGVAHVTYHLEKDNAGSVRRAISNIIREGDAYFRGEEVDDESFRGVVSVLTRDRYDRLHTRYFKEIIVYLFLGAVPALFPYVLYRVKQSEVDALLRRAKRTK